MDMLKDLILPNRSYRRFYQDHPVSAEALKEMIDMARLSASARNDQSLKYYISVSAKTNELIFPTLAWAGYLADWNGPAEGERPSAYILVLNDDRISKNFLCDHGIASQSILLRAVEMGLGGCIIASVQRKELSESLNLPAHLQILHVIALGKPKEKVVIEKTGKYGDIKYWRDKDGIHHVPKRPLDEIIINF